MADAILTINRTAELKKACAAVLTCKRCFDKFVSHAPLTDTHCEHCRESQLWIKALHQIYGNDARLQSADQLSENPRTE